MKIFCLSPLRALAVAWSVLACIPAGAQQLAKEYTPEVSAAPIPAEFITPAKKRYEEELKQIERKEKSRTRTYKKNFYLESSYSLDKLMKSGKVLFNDPIQLYLNKVADRLLEHDPALRSKVHFYPVKFEAANAFATGSGNIFINIGLLARLENEAQLALVMSHEINHYVKQHSLELYVKVIEIDKQKGDIAFSSDEKKLMQKSNHSKENELEADSLGAVMYLKTGYSRNVDESTMDMLLFSDYPVPNIRFEPEFFGTPYIYFPHHFQLDTVTAENYDEYRPDSIATHPNIAHRKTALKSVFSNHAGAANKADYLVSEKDFKQVKEIALFELSRLYLLDGNLSDAIYFDYWLLQEYPENVYLNKKMLGSLAALTSAYNSSLYLSKLVAKPDQVTGEVQRMHYWLHRMNREELNIVVIRYAWGLHKKYPSDMYINEVLDGLLKDYALHYRNNLKGFAHRADFNRESIDAAYKEAPEEVYVDKKGRTKKKAAKKRTYSFKTSFARFAFADVLDDDKEFADRFNSVAGKVKTELRSADADEDDEAEAEEEKEVKPKKGSKKRRTLTDAVNGVNDLILIDPDFIMIDKRMKGVSMDYVSGERKRQEMRTEIRECAKAAGIKLSIFSPYDLNFNDIEKYNDMCLLKDWLGERLENDRPRVPTDYERLVQVSDKYDAQYGGMLINIGIVEKRSFEQACNAIYGTACMGYLFAPLAPVVTAAMLSPNGTTGFVVVIYNLKTGEMVYKNVVAVPQTDSKDLLKSQLYSIMLDLKK